MNIALAHNAASTWKRIKLQHISAVCGIAIAAGAALALGGWEGSAAKPAAPVRTSPSTPRGDAAPPTDAMPQFVFFIAGSQQQADDYRASITQDLDPAMIGNFSFVVITNSEEEARANFGASAHELAAHGVSFEIVDLRNR